MVILRNNYPPQTFIVTVIISVKTLEIKLRYMIHKYLEYPSNEMWASMAVLEVIESCRKASDDGNKSVDIRLLPKSTEKSLTSKLNPVVTKNKQPLF